MSYEAISKEFVFLKAKFSTKFQRPVHFQNWFRAEMLLNQQTDANGEISDTLLICNGGTIRAHAFLLQAASPFLQLAIASQGENYPFVREILIPDFSVKLMEQVVGLIYKGFVEIKGGEEVSMFKEALEFFQITSVDYSKERTCPVKGVVKILETNRIPQDIFKKVEKSEFDDDSKPNVVVQEAKRNGRGVTDSDSNEDFVPNGVSPPKWRGRSAADLRSDRSLQPFVKLTRIDSVPRAHTDPVVPGTSLMLHGPENQAGIQINGAKNVVVRTGPRRHPAIHPAPSSRAGSGGAEVIDHVSPTKKKRVPALKITINKTTPFGNKLSFTLQKKRFIPSPDPQK